MELLHQPGDIIAKRYRILNFLGQGGVAITYEAEDLQSSQRVALKALSLRRMVDWKIIELFEREARILSQLDHPAIPHYLDYFQVDTPQDRSFYIVQELAPGKSLAVLVENGWQPTRSEVQRIATQILEILVYLQEFTPPIIHRDIKPQNIIRQEDGQVFLVDFGAVQDTYHNTVTGGSTVVGTYGYMAPEQFRGQAVLSTDLYGLGTTLLFLLSGKSPSDLPQRKLRIDFRSHVRLDKEFADWLEKMLEPVTEDRFQSAQEALAVLQGKQISTRLQSQKSSQPKNSLIWLANTDHQLLIEIPPVVLSSNYSLLFGLFSLFGYGCLLVILLTWIIEIVEQAFDVLPPLVIYYRLLLMLPLGFCGMLIGLGASNNFLLSGAFSTRLEFDQKTFRLQRWLLGLHCMEVEGKIDDIVEVKLSNINLPRNKKTNTFCVLKLKLHEEYKLRFGLFLMQSENEWLVSEIRHFLEKRRQRIVKINKG